MFATTMSKTANKNRKMNEIRKMIYNFISILIKDMSYVDN